MVKYGGQEDWRKRLATFNLKRGERGPYGQSNCYILQRGITDHCEHKESRPSWGLRRQLRFKPTVFNGFPLDFNIAQQAAKFNIKIKLFIYFR